LLEQPSGRTILIASHGISAGLEASSVSLFYTVQTDRVAANRHFWQFLF
jgi:hypothetical protein